MLGSRQIEQATVEKTVLDIVRGLLEELGGERALAAVRPDASLERDLGLGSLERVELLSRLESELSVEIPETVLAEAETPADLMMALLSAKGATAKWTSNLALAPSSRIPPPAQAQTLLEVLRSRAEAEPRRHHVYLHEDDGEQRVLTYAELYREALAVAGGLAARGLERGDTVALMLPTSRDFFIAFSGVLLAGGVPVPLYPPFRPDRMEEYASRQSGIVRSSGAGVFITGESVEAVGYLLRSRAPELRDVTTVGALRALASPAAAVEVDLDSPALIQYTSGSTGDPKGVLLTHRNLLANVRAIGQALDIRATDVGVSWLPLYHDMGLIGCWLTPLYFGIPVAILSPLAFLSRPERWLWAIHGRRATLSVAPNFGYELCVKRIGPHALEGLDLSCWRAALNGAEPVSPDTLERFTHRFSPYGFRREAFMPVYGLAESSVALTASPLGRAPRVERVSRERFEREGRAVPAAEGEHSPLRFVSVGKPLSAHEVRIVDTQGDELPERVEGVLQFRGPSTMRGYYRNPQATEAVFRPGGWVDSGDRGFLADEEIFITGRAKDIIIRAGRNICPQEVEESVGSVEGIRRGCVAAFGVSDDRHGTEKLVVVAETKTKDREEKARIVRALQERLVDIIGAPADDVRLVPPGAIAKTPSGKVRRSTCRDRYLGAHPTKSAYTNRLLLMRVAILEALIHAHDVVGRFWRAAYGSYAVLLAAVSIVPFWLLALAAPPRRWVAMAVRLGARLYLFLSGCRLRVKGLEHLERISSSASILVSNHASYLDPVPLLAAIPVDFAFVVKREAASWPIIGTFIRRLDYVAVERADPRESLEGAEQVGRVLAEGRSVFFFPEGTFTYAAGLRPFKLGAFRVAAATGRAVVPVALRGTRRWLRDKTWLPRRADLEIVVEEPLCPASGALSDIVRLRDRAALAIAGHLGEPRLDLIAAGPATSE